MKDTILVLVGLFVILGIGNIANGTQLGLAGAWLFDEGSGKAVKDVVGTNHGEIVGSLKWVDGIKGKGLEFAGAGDSYVSIPHKAYMDADPFTFTAWIKLQEASWQYIVWKNGLVWPEPHAKRHLDIWVHDADYPVLMWHLEGGGDGRLDGKAIIADGKWHHIAKASYSKTMRLFIDGKLDGEAVLGGKIAINGEDPMWIGARPGNVAATGVFDEIGFFTKALNEAELKEVMDKGLMVLSSVKPEAKLTATWGDLKTK